MEFRTYATGTRKIVSRIFGSVGLAEGYIWSFCRSSLV
jgi:hypothetical protein